MILSRVAFWSSRKEKANRKKRNGYKNTVTGYSTSLNNHRQPPSPSCKSTKRSTEGRQSTTSAQGRPHQLRAVQVGALPFPHPALRVAGAQQSAEATAIRRATRPTHPKKSYLSGVKSAQHSSTHLYSTASERNRHLCKRCFGFCYYKTT